MLGNSLTELARRTGRSGDEHARQSQGPAPLPAQHAQKRRFLIAERQLVKAEKHPKFRFAQYFYAFHGVNRQTFSTFETVDELKAELALYLLYYNTDRPHQGLGGKTPLQTL